MGSFGLSEILLILIIAFLILGPDKLPQFLRSIGKAFGEISSIKKELEKTVVDATDSVNEAASNHDPGEKKKQHKKEKKSNNQPLDRHND